jgi:uroporphyrinogen decarboxylase
MKEWERKYMYKANREPDFNNLLAVLKKEKPARPTLFEFFLNGTLYGMLSKGEFTPKDDGLDNDRTLMHAFKNAGYDYYTSSGSWFGFHRNARDHALTASINEGFIITDRKSFEEYKWNEVEDCDYSNLSKIAPELPDGMKIICSGPGGVLENAISLVGYDNLCLMLYDDPELAEEIFKNIGERELKHYTACLEHDSVGAVIGNDDWGFKTQTMLSVEQMRKYVFPWHKKIVELAHSKGRPAILHSCGYAGEIMDDIIDDMKYDGNHSYEDIIQPVEEAYVE